MGQQGQDRFPDVPHPAAHAALQLGGGGFGSQDAGGMDELPHGLGLGEIHPPGEKGPLGELPRGRGNGPQGIAVLQQPRRHGLGPVGEKLHQILPGIAVLGAVAAGETEVQQGSVPGQQAAIAQLPRRSFAQRPPGAGEKEPVGDGQGFRPRQPEDGDAAGHTAAAAGGDGIGHGAAPPFL